MRSVRERGTGVVVATAGLSAILCSLPLFLTGALAVNIRDDIAIDAAGLGLAVALFRLIQMASVRTLGRFADRFGAVTSLRASLVFAAVSCLGVVALASSWTTLVLCLSIGALGKGLVTPAANRLIVNTVPKTRQGLAFGFKQAAAPAATMLGGVSVPLVAGTIGWRWAFAFVVLLAPLMVVLIGPRPSSVPRGVSPRRRRAEPLEDRRTVIVLATALFMGTSASSIIPVFYVDSVVAAGGSVAVGGVFLAVASLGAILIRIATGAICDRMDGGHLRLAGALVAIGAVGLLMIALGGTWVMGLGVIVGMGCGWGYPAVLWYAILRSYREAPGQITGAVSFGGLLGGSLAPLTFGFMVQFLDYATAWIVVAAVSVASTFLMFAADRRLERRHDRWAVDRSGTGDA